MEGEDARGILVYCVLERTETCVIRNLIWCQDFRHVGWEYVKKTVDVVKVLVSSDYEMECERYAKKLRACGGRGLGWFVTWSGLFR